MKKNVAVKPTDVPQADRLDKIRSLLEAIQQGEGILQIIDSTKLSARHIEYYIDAAEVLNLILRVPGGSLSLTSAGEQLLKHDSAAPEYRDALAKQIAISPILQKLAPGLLSANPPEREALAAQIAKFTGLASSTADRRAGTLLSWRRQLLPYQTAFAGIDQQSKPMQSSSSADVSADIEQQSKSVRMFASTSTPHYAKTSEKLPQESSTTSKPRTTWAPTQSAYQGQIRRSQINLLLEKARKLSYGKYLSKVLLQKARGFVQQEVIFAFPVTALIGPNGGGKTTILGAAACAYDDIKPRRFFSKSGRLDDSMKDWSIEYEVVDRGLNPKSTFRRTASFKSSKWSRNALKRDVLVFGVGRTVPASERPDMRRCTSSNFVVRPDRVAPLNENVALAVQRILGKDVDQFSYIRVDNRGRVSLLSGRTPSGVGYSEFHFGAGESSVIRMVMRIENAAPHCLILIEEIENGLHPVATIRMVEYLIDVAERKSAQAVFTTHSNDALKPLPSEAIWASVDQTVFQGKLDVHALRAITGQVESQLVIFVEDEFASRWIDACIRTTDPAAHDLVEVHAMHGDGMAVRVNRHHNLDPSATAASICYIDGDSQQKTSEDEAIYRLPGESPEAYVYDTVLEKLDTESGRLAIGLHQRYEDQARIATIVRDVRMLNHDPHLLFSQVGERLGYLAEEVVRSCFLAIWAQQHPEELSVIMKPILARLPKRTALSTPG